MGHQPPPACGSPSPQDQLAPASHLYQHLLKMPNHSTSSPELAGWHRLHLASLAPRDP